MKNNIQLITNEIVEIANEKKQRELERKERKHKNEFKELCRALIITTIAESQKNGATLDYLFLHSAEIIRTIREDIKAQYITISDPAKWDYTKTKQTRLYNYPDYEIDDIVTTLFYIEYKKAKRLDAEKTKITKNQISAALLDYLHSTFEYAIEKRANLYTLYITLKQPHHRDNAINALADNDFEADYITTIYQKTLDAVKREYNVTKPKATPKRKKQRLALPWRILGYTKAIKTIWKM